MQFFSRYKYPNMSITLGDFKLEVMDGEFTDCQVSVVLGESGSGKTTFLQLLVESSMPFIVYILSLDSLIKISLNFSRVIWCHLTMKKGYNCGSRSFLSHTNRK